MKAAIKYCIDNNILKDFLKRHGSEVENMLFAEITTEEYGEIRFNEGREEGEEKRNQYVLELINQGLSTEEIKQRLMQKEKKE